jgi:hypothetical protein
MSSGSFFAAGGAFGCEVDGVGGEAVSRLQGGALPGRLLNGGGPGVSHARRADHRGRRLVVRSRPMIALALVVVGAMVGYSYAGDLVSIIGIRTVGGLAGAGVGSLVGLLLSLLNGE